MALYFCIKHQLNKIYLKNGKNDKEQFEAEDYQVER